MNNRRVHTGLDSTQLLMLRNDKLKEGRALEMQRINTDEMRTAELLEKQIKELRLEIRDLRAYTIVYKENSLKYREKHKAAVDYDNLYAKQLSAKSVDTLHDKPARHQTSLSKKSDPFRLYNCLVDAGCYVDERETKLGGLPRIPIKKKAQTVKRELERSRTAKIRRKGQESLLPGNCTSYYSARRYYEKEKDKILIKWSPEKRRQRTIESILKNSRQQPNTSMTYETAKSMIAGGRRYTSLPNLSIEILA